MAKRGRKPKERKGYFYEREEQAIVDYTKTDSIEEKNRIFNTILFPALTKMIESIIRRYKLFVPDEEFPQTFNDTISYLLTKINNFKPEMYVYTEVEDDTAKTTTDITASEFVELRKNANANSPQYIRVFRELLNDDYSTIENELLTKENELDSGEEEPLFRTYKLSLKHYKAYSYCGTVCKNYLIYKNIQYTKNRQRNTPYDTVADDFSSSLKYSSHADESTPNFVEQLIKDVSTEIKTMINKKEENQLNENEIKVGTALTELLDNWEELLNVDGSNKLQKSSVLYFLREETMMTTKEVRDNMRSFKKAYYLLKKNMIEDE